MSWMQDAAGLLKFLAGVIAAVVGYFGARKAKQLKNAQRVNDIIIENDKLKAELISRIDELHKQYLELNEMYTALQVEMQRKDARIAALEEENASLKEELRLLEDKVKGMEDEK